MLIDIIGGARPNFVKIAPIIRAIQDRQSAGADIKFRLIHTGQHYDNKMSGSFFTELGLPAPDINLKVGSGTQAIQTGKILVAYESVLQESSRPDVCLVVGDVNSTMACAITAKKCGITVAHVEAGIRSGDWSMPEEVNRVVTDSITDWFYTTGIAANRNLLASGVPQESIVFVGNTMIDTLLQNKANLKVPSCWGEHGLSAGGYLVLTLHRPGNVDQSEQLIQTLREISRVAENTPVVFPVHPRTANVLGDAIDEFSNVLALGPLGYLEFNYLVSCAAGVITDSGGITEETTVLGVPCMTLRNSTERPETVEIGTNVIVGTELSAIEPWLTRMLSGDWKSGGIPEKWDGLAGEKIADHLLTLSHQ